MPQTHLQQYLSCAKNSSHSYCYLFHGHDFLLNLAHFYLSNCKIEELSVPYDKYKTCER